MTKNKSFFQKLSDSLTSLFPFNSTAKEIPNTSQLAFDQNASSGRFPSNRRIASEVFGQNDDQTNIKRAKLHHDPLDLPSSRIMKPPLVQLSQKFVNHNNFNDTASDFSDMSNVSVSTSGVSSLHPRSNKRINLSHSEDVSTHQNRKYPRNLNLSQKDASPVLNKSLRLKNDFMSSPARKILEKLDRLTTPVTAGNKLNSLVQRDNCLNQSKPSPYSRPKLPICGKKPAPMKAITVSASSNELVSNSCGPIRGKKFHQPKKLGYSESIDLDSNYPDNDYPRLCESAQVNFSNIPLLMKSQATNTDESFLGRSSPPLEFTFRSPKSINDPDDDHMTPNRLPEYRFLSRITREELDRSSHVPLVNTTRSLWKCTTCLTENFDDRSDCEGCGSLASQNNHHITVSEKMAPVTVDKSALVKRLLENDNGNSAGDDTKVTEISTANSKSTLFTSSSVGAPSSGLFGNVPASSTSSDSRLSLFPGSSTSVPTVTESKTSLFPGLGSANSSNSDTKLFSFGNGASKSISTGAESTGLVFGASTSVPETVSSAQHSAVSTPAAAAAAVTASSIITSTVSATSAPSIVSSAESKPFTFGSVVSSSSNQSAVSNVPSFGVVASSGTVTNPVFSFGAIPAAVKSSSNQSSSSLNSVLSTSTVTNPVFSFGGASATVPSTTKPSSTFDTVITSTTVAPVFSFGAAPKTVSSSSNPPTFGTVVTTSNIAPAFSFGAVSTVTATTSAVSITSNLFGASKPDSVVSAVSMTTASVSSWSQPKSVSLFGQNAPAPLDSKPFTFGQVASTTTTTPVVKEPVASKPISIFGGVFGSSSSGALPTSPAVSSTTSIFSFGSKSSSATVVTTTSTASTPGMFQFGAVAPAVAPSSSSSTVTTATAPAPAAMFLFGGPAPAAQIRSEPLSTTTAPSMVFGAVTQQSTSLFGTPAVMEPPVSNSTLPGFSFSANAPAVSLTTPQFGAFNSTFSAAPSSVAASKPTTFMFVSQPQQPVAVATASITGSTNLFGGATQSVTNTFNQSSSAPAAAAFQFGAPPNNPPVAINNNVNSSLPQGAFDFKASTVAAPAFQFGAVNPPVANSNNINVGLAPAFQFGGGGGAGAGAINNGGVYSFNSGAGGAGNIDPGSGQVAVRRTLKVRRKR